MGAVKMQMVTIMMMFAALAGTAALPPGGAMGGLLHGKHQSHASLEEEASVTLSGSIRININKGRYKYSAQNPTLHTRVYGRGHGTQGSFYMICQHAECRGDQHQASFVDLANGRGFIQLNFFGTGEDRASYYVKVPGIVQRNGNSMTWKPHVDGSRDAELVRSPNSKSSAFYMQGAPPYERGLVNYYDRHYLEAGGSLKWPDRPAVTEVATTQRRGLLGFGGRPRTFWLEEAEDDEHDEQTERES